MVRVRPGLNTNTVGFNKKGIKGGVNFLGWRERESNSRGRYDLEDFKWAEEFCVKFFYRATYFNIPGVKYNELFFGKDGKSLLFFIGLMFYSFSNFI